MRRGCPDLRGLGKDERKRGWGEIPHSFELPSLLGKRKEELEGGKVLKVFSLKTPVSEVSRGVVRKRLENLPLSKGFRHRKGPMRVTGRDPDDRFRGGVS